LFIAQGGQAGQQRPQDRLADGYVNQLFPVARAGTNAPMAGSPIELKAVLPAYRQQIVNQTDDTATGTHEDAAEDA
jgi:hypothetical protein